MKIITLSVLSTASLFMINTACLADAPPAKEPGASETQFMPADEYKALYKASVKIATLLLQDETLYPDDPSKMRALSILSSIDLSDCPADFRKKYNETLAELKKADEAGFSTKPIFTLFKQFRVVPAQIAPALNITPELGTNGKEASADPADKQAIKDFFSQQLSKSLDLIDKLDAAQIQKEFVVRSAEKKKTFDICLNLFIDAFIYQIDLGIQNDNIDWKPFLEKQDTSTWPKPLADGYLQYMKENHEHPMIDGFIEVLLEAAMEHYDFDFEDILDTCFDESATSHKIEAMVRENNPDPKKLKKLVEQFRKEVLEKYDTAEKIDNPQ